MTSSLFLKFFTFYVGHLSNEQEPDPVLIHLCNESCTQASFPKIIPQFLALNSNQLVESSQKIHPMDVVVIDCFEDIPSVVLPESRDVLINLPNYESLRIGIRDSIIQISKALQCHKHLKAENLVLNNFVWSSESIEYLLTTFNELKNLMLHLSIQIASSIIYFYRITPLSTSLK